MKKLLVCLLALAMLMGAVALADAKVVKITELEQSISLCSYSNNYIARTDMGYCLYDQNGNALSATYKSMSPAEKGKYLKVQNVGTSTNLNCIGLLDAQGNMILPMQYGSIITYYAQDWVFAHVLSPATGDVGEYSDSKGNKYIISRTDLVYKGEMVGSLSRDDFQGSYSVTDRGAYIFIKITDQKGYWLDSSLNRLDVSTDKSYIDRAEFSTNGDRVIHNPTGTQAFTANCPLTPEQVGQHMWFDGRHNRLLDLQGNVVSENLYYDRVQYRTNYLEIETNSYQSSGVMTFDGKIIIPAQYSYIARDTISNCYFSSGYNAVIDDEGNLFFYDEAGNITASAEYGLTYNDYKGFNNNAPILHVKNLNKYMIITATHGTLPETYDEALTCGEHQKVIAVRKGENWGVIDMAGNVVVPFESRYSPSISSDGTVIHVQKTYGSYDIYQLTYEDAAAVQPATVTPAPAAPVADGAWSCSCGAQNTGKFCAECGSKKPEPTPAPAADGSWDCTCGSHNTGKFCPECGTKKPEVPVEPQCSSCGYKPEGDTPKFCPECGTKF